MASLIIYQTQNCYTAIEWERKRNGRKLMHPYCILFPGTWNISCNSIISVRYGYPVKSFEYSRYPWYSKSNLESLVIIYTRINNILRLSFHYNLFSTYLFDIPFWNFFIDVHIPQLLLSFRVPLFLTKAYALGFFQYSRAYCQVRKRTLKYWLLAPLA